MLNALSLTSTLYRRLSAVLFIMGLSSVLMAQGNLLITPKRVVFDNSKRSQVINLANIGKDTARYAISFIQIRMKDDGTFEEIKEPDAGQNFSDKHLRIFPRTVTLAPNEAQVVKVQVSQYDKLTSGEYRSHLYFRAISNEAPLGEKSAQTDSSKLSVKLTPVFGISIPMIIRSGPSNAKVNISHIKLESTPESLKILTARFNRSGNMSVYGDFSVQHISNTGKITPVGMVRGLSVYTPNQAREVKIKLDNKAGIDYTSGKLLLSYTNSVDGKSEKLASSELVLN
ncbi:molecular chaperone [Paradesertivirga mongoliensis]|uniref:Molecular chaperone n=1 Tax=Paradesertivirga mongoliensis TaxID=2100740 RepID=A0ABW4ZNS6_9SPHI|nr:hypothetical protein [Pedobacter mongoliensis]